MAEQVSTENTAQDIIVIGAGIIGITTAIELLHMGAKVTGPLLFPMRRPWPLPGS